MKFYVHCEELDMTVVVKWDNITDKVSELAEVVQANIEKRFPDLFKDNIERNLIFSIRGKNLCRDDVVVKKIKHMDDVNVCLQVSEKKIPAKTVIIEDYHKLAENMIENHRLRRAILVYEDVLRIDSQNLKAYIGIVDCYLKAKRPQKALQYIKRLEKLNIHDSQQQIQYRLGQCYLGTREADKAIEVLQKYCVELRKSGGTSTYHKHQVQVLLAKAYIQKGQKDMAIVILQGVLREDQTCIDALADYAPLLYPLGPAQSEEAMTVLLTLLANNRENSYIKEKFTWACQQPHGLKILESVAGRAWEDIASLVFIATSLREFGAISEALSIMKHAYELKREEAHTLLTYVHMLELIEEHTEAVRLIRQYIEDFPKMCIHTFTCRDFLPITKFLSLDQVVSDIDVEVPTVDVPCQNVKVEFSADQIYLLALLHTLVKILYIKGNLRILPFITSILDPLSENQDLHLTNIRNEAAYFTCISKVLKTLPNLCVNLKDQRCIYFIGDSHCITPAWQNIKYKEETHLIYPVLSTGTKIWHLRKESQFYPKINFYNAIKVIPDSSVCVLCFGEIDCREALLLCVEKAKYDSLEEAIEAVIDIYIKVIKDLYDRFKWEIFVHPVMPVLDVTRSIVMKFNTCLKQRVEKETWISWLNFVEDMLCINGTGSLVVKDKYKFDGTHAHPCYTALLETFLKEPGH